MKLEGFKLKLGSRRSLLAWAQSQWVAREVERLNPQIQVELVGIETQGDRIQDIPLSKVEGKNFFVAELDLALKEKRVDFAVHSLKDLSLERPTDLTLAAIPKRENPRDVVLFGPRTLERLKAGQPLKIGTSAPRRLENVPSFLKKALPHQPQLEFIEIRGNVNTRLSRVHEDPSAPKALDGVVLAFAGLIRLWQDPAGKRELERLLQGVRWMVLPLSHCPAAPGQAALAVECRKGDFRVEEALRKLHNEAAAAQIRRERALLEGSGGGCHQRFGATAVQSSELGELFYVKGKTHDGKDLEELSWQVPAGPSGKAPVKPWDGQKWRVSEEGESLSQSKGFDGASAFFVAHARAVQALSREGVENLEGKRVWTSGVSSWFQLAELGIWVEGCAEGFGFQDLKATLTEPVLTLPEFKQWAVLTHEGAQVDWIREGINVIPTYRIQSGYSTEAKAALREATYVFWSSGSQYDELKENVNPDAIQACGPGKTAVRLRGSGLMPLVFPSVKEWRKWIGI